MINSNYECFDLTTFVSNYAKTIQKPVAFIRVWGWNHSDNVEEINNSMQIYKQFLPLDLYTMMFNSEFVFVELDDNIQEVMEFFTANFPASQLDCKNEMYIHFSLYNSLGQIILSNE